MASTVSPGATVTAVPPSQLQLAFGAGLRTTDREASGAPAAFARAWVGPCNTALLLPPGAPAVPDNCAGCGASGRLSTRLAGAPRPIQPRASGMLADEEGLSCHCAAQSRDTPR